jgi:fibronectin-binding autotransporter adhesin
MRHALPRFTWFGTIASIALLLAATADAGTTYYWYGSDTTLGGAGTWDTNSTYWSSGSTSKTGVAWPNTTDYDAVLNGSSGALTLSGSITVGGLDVYTAGYSISSGTLAIGGDGVISNLSAAGTATVSSAVSLLASQTWNVAARVFAVTGVISGDYSITKSGAGTLTLTGANTYTGGTTLSAGYLMVGNDSALGSGSVTLSGGSLVQGMTATVGNTITNTINVTGTASFGRLNTDATAAFALAGSLTGSGTLKVVGNKNWNVLSGDNSEFTGTVWVNINNNLSLRNCNSGSAKAKWYLDNGNNSRFYLDASGDFHFGELSSVNTIARVLGNTNDTTINVVVGELNTDSTYAGYFEARGTNSTIALTKAGTGTFTVSGSSSLTGGTYLNGGTLFLSGIDALGNTGTIAFGGGTLTFSGSNTVDYSSRLSSASNQAFNIDTNGQNVTFASGLASSGGSLTKLGSGVLTLSGSCSYTGPTVVSGGSLRVSGTGSIAASSGATVSGGASLVLTGGAAGSVTVAGGGILAGYGSAGSVYVQSGGTIGSSSDNTTWGGTLALTNLTLADATEVNLGNVGNYATAGITVSGTADVASAMFVRFWLYGAAPVGKSTVHLIQYAGSVNSTVYTLGGVSFGNSRSTYTLGSSTSGGTVCIDLNCTVDYPYWTGAGDGVWTTATQTTKNWKLVTAGTETDYIEGDTVLFDDRVGVTSATVTLGQDVSPSGILFNNSSSVSYTISGGAGNYTIGGAGGLTLNGGTAGAGTVTLLTNSTSTGVVTINAGTLQVGNGGTSGSISGDVASKGTLVFNRSDAYTFDRVISGTGSVSVTGGGTLTLSADSTYTGTTTVDAGNVLQIGTGSTTGLIASSIHIVNGGTLVLNRSNTYTYANPISGGGNLTVTGGSVLILAADNTFTGTTTIATGSTLQLGAGSTSGAIDGDVVNNGLLTFNRSNNYTFSHVISGTGGVTITTGGSTLTLTGDNTYTGQTYLNIGGALRVGNGGTAGSLQSGLLVNWGGVMMFDRSDAYTISCGTVAGYGLMGFTGGGTATLVCAANTYNSGTITIAADTTLQVGNGSTTGLIVTTTNNSVTIVNDGTLIFNRSNASSCTQNISGSGSLVKQGAGALTLSGTNTYSGSTTLSAGSLVVPGASAIGTGAIALTGGTLTNTALCTLANSITVADGAITCIKGAPSGSTNYFTLNGNIAGGTGGTLTLNPAVSRIFLGGDNSGFSGTFAIDTTAGYVFLNVADAGSAQAKFALSGTGTTYKVYTIGSGTVHMGELSGSTGTVLSSSSATVVYQVGALNTDSTYAGIFIENGTASGVTSLTKVGSGILTLSDVSDYTGPTTVNSGVLAYGVDNAVSSNSVVTVNGGTLSLGACSGTVAAVTLTSGAITGTGTLTSTAGFSVASGQISAVLGGSMGLTKSTAGTVTLSGANVYTGTTAVNGGALVIQGDVATSAIFSGTTDIGAGRLVFDYAAGGSATGAGIANSVSSILTASYNSGTNSWASGAIHSTLANSHSTDSYALGWSNNTATSAVTVKVVLYGDATMDGTVNIYDLGQVLANYNKSGVWATGDFNYDGTVNIYDLGTVLANYNKSLSLSEATVNPLDYSGLDGEGVAALRAAGVNVVPEPGTLALLTAAAIGLLAYGWRRRKQFGI